jgi:hypothetical protein
MRGRDVMAGALLVNAIPHTIIGLAGQRGMTPLGGPDSPPAANLVWAGLNILAGVAMLGAGAWRSIDQPSADERLRGVTLGIIAMAAFAAVYELTPAARHRLTRAGASLRLRPATTARPAGYRLGGGSSATARH